MAKIKLICKNGHKRLYEGQDIGYSFYQGEIDEAWVYCKTCRERIEASEELIKELPDYEPDPDIEYERNWLIEHGMP